MADPNPEYGPPLSGEFHWPRLGGRGAFLFHRYDAHVDARGRRVPAHDHQGIDLEAPVGREWLAVADGVIRNVVNAPTDGFLGYGRCVVLEHKDRATGRYVWFFYAHGLEVLVRPGQHVRRGDVLGKVGRSQWARFPTRPEGTMPPHLHLEASLRPYPQGPESPTRVDPLFVLRSLPGVPEVPTPGAWLIRPEPRTLANYASLIARADRVSAPVNGLVDASERRPLPSARRTPRLSRGSGDIPLGGIVLVVAAAATAAVLAARR